MLSATKRVFKIFLVVAVTAICLSFSITNREMVAVGLFPLPYSAEMPLFLLALLCFAFGSIVAGILMSYRIHRVKSMFRAEQKHVAALKNELSGIHSEQQLRPLPPAIHGH